MFKYTEGELKIDGVKIHYYRTGGRKPPFILLHGATDNGLCWTKIAGVLAASYDVIMPDAQGHGLSDRLDKGFNYQTLAAQVAGLTQQLGLKKPIIMGHSMGADTAVNVAIEHPVLPRAIILEDPPWAMTAPLKIEKRGEVGAPPVDMVECLNGLNKLSLEEIIEEGKKLNPSWTDADRLYWAKAKQQFDASLFSRAILNPRNYEELVTQIKCPTLLITAEKGVVSKEVAENIARLWKSKQPFKWVRIKDTTHNIRRDNFEEYKAAVFDFLKTLPA